MSTGATRVAAAAASAAAAVSTACGGDDEGGGGGDDEGGEAEGGGGDENGEAEGGEDGWKRALLGRIAAGELPTTSAQMAASASLLGCGAAPSPPRHVGQRLEVFSHSKWHAAQSACPHERATGHASTSRHTGHLRSLS